MSGEPLLSILTCCFSDPFQFEEMNAELEENKELAQNRHCELEKLRQDFEEVTTQNEKLKVGVVTLTSERKQAICSSACEPAGFMRDTETGQFSLFRDTAQQIRCDEMYPNTAKAVCDLSTAYIPYEELQGLGCPLLPFFSVSYNHKKGARMRKGLQIGKIGEEEVKLSQSAGVVALHTRTGEALES